VRTTYDRHGGVQRTSSRRVMQKYFKRCSYCAGRVLVLDQQRVRADSDALFAVDDANLKSETDPDSTTVQRDEYDATRGIMTSPGSHGVADVRNEEHDENEEIKEQFNTDRNKLRLTLSPPIMIVNSPTPPSLTDDSVGEGWNSNKRNSYVASPGFVNSYKDSLPSPNSGNGASTFYQAGSLLRQSHYEITTRTTQLVENTPSRLHTFFTHVLRRRKHGSNTESRRGSKINLHKIFHFSTSPKTSARHRSTSSRGEGEECVVNAAELSTVPERRSSGASGVRRRFNFSKTLKISRQEYVNRRKSTPVQFYRRRAGSSAPQTPEEEEMDPSDALLGKNQLASKSQSSLSRAGKSGSKRDLWNQSAAAKSHDALSAIDQPDAHLGKKNQLTSKSHSSLSRAGQSGSKHDLRNQSAAVKSHSALSTVENQSDKQSELNSQSLKANEKQTKRSRSLIDLLHLRKKPSSS